MSYSVTVYATGGVPGHVFYTLADEQQRMRSFALYPRSFRELFLHGLVAPVPGEVRTNDLLQPRSAQAMTARTFDISAVSYQKLLAASQNAMLRPPHYDLDNYNCVTFTRQMLGSIGIDFTSIPFNLPGQVRLDLALGNIEDSIRAWRDGLQNAYQRYIGYRSGGEPAAALQVLEQTLTELGGDESIAPPAAVTRLNPAEPERLRLLVMNGQRIVQRAEGASWVEQRTLPANGLRPSLYYFGTATDASRAKTYSGPIVHTDERFAYQRIGTTGFVRHELTAFADTVDIGPEITVAYAADRAVVSAPSAASALVRR